MTEELKGYSGDTLKHLLAAGAAIGDQIRVTTSGQVLEGILIPRSEFADDKHLLIKLKSGYNVGLRIQHDTKIQVLGKGAKPSFVRPEAPAGKESLPKVVIMSTGGTIASRVDYRTGGVEPALTSEDLYSVVPELSSLANVETIVLYSEFSENLTSKHWSEIAEKVATSMRAGADGVIVAHGTDTLGFTSAALSFALQNLPVPVVVVGSQRSSDRPSSDAATNLLAATLVCSQAPLAGVFVAMHETSSDDYVVLHKGTKVRKCHTSSRYAFESVNALPVAKCDLRQKSIHLDSDEVLHRDKSRSLELKPTFDDKVALIKFYPGMNPAVVDWYVEKDYKGIVFEGTGLGHVSRYCYDAIERARTKGLILGMTSQCIWGRVNMNVYYTGRDLLARGIIPLDDMLPETALVKMMWAFGQTSSPQEVQAIMKQNIAGELSERTLLD